MRRAGLKAIFVFVAPPSLEELERRLRGRGTESEEQVTRRLKNAREEMARSVVIHCSSTWSPCLPARVKTVGL